MRRLRAPLALGARAHPRLPSAARPAGVCAGCGARRLATVPRSSWYGKAISSRQTRRTACTCGPTPLLTRAASPSSTTPRRTSTASALLWDPSCPRSRPRSHLARPRHPALLMPPTQSCEPTPPRPRPATTVRATATATPTASLLCVRQRRQAHRCARRSSWWRVRRRQAARAAARRGCSLFILARCRYRSYPVPRSLALARYPRTVHPRSIGRTCLGSVDRSVGRAISGRSQSGTYHSAR